MDLDSFLLMRLGFFRLSHKKRYPKLDNLQIIVNDFDFIFKKMHLIARILVTNSSRTNQKRIINKFGSYLLARNASSTQQQIEKTVQELTKENGNLIAGLQGRIAQLQKEKEQILKEFGKKLAEEDKQLMLQMYGKKVQLPSEEWYNFANQIGDHQSAGNLQSFHDEHREITLGRMEIIPPRYNVPSDRPMVEYRHPDGYKTTDLPDSPMPANVKNFEGITMTYVDMDVVDFLRKFQENNLLANLRLDLSCEGKNHILPMLDEILPLISSIYSLNSYDLFDWIYDNDQQYQDNDNNAKEFKPLLTTMVAQTKILAIRWYTNSSTKCTWEDKFDWCCSWLYTPRDDGKPRALISEYNIEETHCSSFIDRIKKDFLEANQAVSFYILLVVPEDFNQPEISLENNKTNEKLVVKAQAGRLLISRRSSKVAKHKIEEEEKEIIEWKWKSYTGPRRICLTRNYD